MSSVPAAAPPSGETMVLPVIVASVTLYAALLSMRLNTAIWLCLSVKMPSESVAHVPETAVGLAGSLISYSVYSTGPYGAPFCSSVKVKFTPSRSRPFACLETRSSAASNSSTVTALPSVVSVLVSPVDAVNSLIHAGLLYAWMVGSVSVSGAFILSAIYVPSRGANTYSEPSTFLERSTATAFTALISSGFAVVHPEAASERSYAASALVE